MVKQAIKKYKISQNFFHSDHGVEYTNHKFANFLKQNNIQQLMFPKGNALANRLIEFFCAFCNENWLILKVKILKMWVFLIKK
ncbi:DDE-type integrase/transposase/recombinase [Mesomycoplasma ovipneumoniae]|uniref:DDE-type integrase/transposase/recombinase n=1 Tax=Mesomycoplasma ovipneumoniae TaxID=29562 RepID=UPI00307FEE57